MELELLGLRANKIKQLEAKGIASVDDLLLFLPRSYKDYRFITGILPKDQISVVRAEIVSCQRRPGNGQQFVTASCRIIPNNVMMTVRWFNMHWIYTTLKPLSEKRTKMVIAGRIEYSESYGYSLNQPDVFELLLRQLKVS